MPNPNPRLENLSSYKPKWKSGKTRTIRVPIAIAERVLQIAHLIDDGESDDTGELIEMTRTNAGIFDDVMLKPEKSPDTSEIAKYSEAGIILKEGLAVPSNKGGEVKQYLAKLGRMLGFEVKKNSKRQWVITDTSK